MASAPWHAGAVPESQVHLLGFSFYLVRVCFCLLVILDGRQTHREPPCVMQGAGDRPGGILPPKFPLAKIAQQELWHPSGHRLVESQVHAVCSCFVILGFRV